MKMGIPRTAQLFGLAILTLIGVNGVGLAVPPSALMAQPMVAAAVQDPTALPLLSVPEAATVPAHTVPPKTAVPPSFAIPVGPIGFASPAPFYLGARVAQVSMSFLDEDNLLFTFRVPGLISRVHSPANLAPGEVAGVDELHNERHIRAVVLSLPSGKVTAESLWRLHDSDQYLWALKGGKFLLRDRNTVLMGDSALHLELFLRFPGPVKSLELDPDQQFLVTNSTEPPAPEKKPVSDADSNRDSSGKGDAAEPVADQDLLRVLNMTTRKVTLFSRMDAVRHVPLDGGGFYETLRGMRDDWWVSYREFKGEAIPLLAVRSTCSPALDVLRHDSVLASACVPEGGRRLSLVTRDKRKLWEVAVPATQVWPVLAKSAEGLRVARASLEVAHPVGPNYPLEPSEVRQQIVQVYDVATGKLELSVPASPVLDGGGNFALSPSGRRFAVLNGGAIQVFDLAPAPAMPAPTNP
jgi:hypothetical protein